MTSKLVQALCRLAGNRQSDGTSSLISGEDREAIITGCHDLMIAARQATPPQEHVEAQRLRRMVERRDEFIIGKGLWEQFKEASNETE